MVTERCELEMHNVRNACLSGMDHVYHSCLDKTAHTKMQCNKAVSTVINGGTCDVLQGKLITQKVQHCLFYIMDLFLRIDWYNEELLF